MTGETSIRNSSRYKGNKLKQSRLTHVDEHGSAHMVDVGMKPDTQRTAIAEGMISMKPATLKLIQEAKTPKGDVLAVARIAAIQAAKQTAGLIPLCHQIPLTRVTVEIELNRKLKCIKLRCSASTVAKTGVEMEALTGTTVGLLAIYDMCKAADRSMEITNIRLLRKSGGQSGEFVYHGRP